MTVVSASLIVTSLQMSGEVEGIYSALLLKTSGLFLKTIS